MTMVDGAGTVERTTGSDRSPDFASAQAYSPQAFAGDMPPPAPLAMPPRPWNDAPAAGLTPAETSPADIGWRRAMLIGLTIVIGLLGGLEMLRSAADGGVDWREALLILLFVPLFAWIGFGFLNALVGFVRLMFGENDHDFALVDAAVAPRQRTAILMPVYNEDIVAVCGRIRRMARSLADAGRAECFDFFLLSDSSAANGVVERAAFLALRREIGSRLFYRRRGQNIERKPGNIADWVRTHGAAYPFMIVLDADSLVSGETMARLAATMEANPGVGLIQTIPTVMGGRTLFARWQQFAARLYGPLASAGLIWWSGAESSFWGHNAILRTRAFAECCGLEPLSGREPFGGPIMSHDMVEAALLRRCGWAVHMVDSGQSFEEYPPTLVDHAKRDRRWCQGNLQHLRLLDAAGLHWVSRLQLLMGGSAYLTSPLWLLLLIAAIVHHYTTGAGVAPSPWLLGATLVILFAPKLLAIGWVLASAERTQGFGGRAGVIASAMLEIPLSILVAPLMMITQTLTLLDIVRGRPSGWAPQRRDVDGMAMTEALRHYRPHLAVGLVMAGLAVAGGGALAWMLPVATGLLVSPLIAVATSRTATGEYLADGGVFMIPEEVFIDRMPLLEPVERRPLPAEPAEPPFWAGRIPPVIAAPVGTALRIVWRRLEHWVEGPRPA